MKNRNLRSSFSHAFNGIIQAFKTERNVKLHTMFGLLAILFGVYFRISVLEWLIVVLTIGFVIVAELLNTAIEYTVDMVCGKTYNELAKYSKDIAAGATLVAAIVAMIIGAIIFIPKII
ncbi:undecaprenol kinase [Petrocella atlantisensis]|uniref:Undecaprenol kinase n=1 Tax=Petrocella atlantisensis TaxID=2173034 RepID=A0A3P7RT84_9FIRM|nr:diacylglycerol kinase family protein [Petrocella atlantisensis]VDN46102.1 undecaprenol kinase [Petrocella atlantisensis]